MTLPARFNKSRKTKAQPLPTDVADALRDYLPAKPAGSPVWGGTWRAKAAEMLRADLEAVGIPYATEGPDGPEYADFHSLRHSYLTLGGRSGIDLRTLQELAGHSTPVLTARYMHVRLRDTAGAVDRLPPLVPPTRPDTAAAEMSLRLTGTEAGKADNVIRIGVVPGVVMGGMEGHPSASSCKLRVVGAGDETNSQPLEMEGAGASQHRPASSCTEWAVPGLNWGPSDFQSPSSDSQPRNNKSLPHADDAGRTAGRTRDGNTSEGEIPNADLAALVAAWPALPDHIRAAIRALVGTVAGVR